MKSLNLLRVVAVAAFAAVMAPASFAQQVSGSVTVKVDLTSKCRWQGGTAPTGMTVDFGTYVAFQGTAQPGTGPTVTFECTRGFGTTPVVTWDTLAADATAAGVGVVAGLQYSLSATAQPRTPGADASATSIGSADTVQFILSGSMPKDQAGAGAGGVTTQARTLYVTF